jgi:hypothetical protein
MDFHSKNPDGSDRVFQYYRNFFLRDSENNYSNNPLFQKIAEFCKNTPNHHDVRYVYNRAHLAYIPGTLPYHIDIRKCVLSLIIDPVVHPIQWATEENEILCEHHYENPVLVNTKIRHGCPANDRDRFLFQIGFDQSFDEISLLV